MKKIFSLAIMLMVFVGFTACSNDDEEQTFSLVGKRFQVEPVDRTEMIDQDGDSLNMTVSRSIQFLDEKTAILACTIEYDYPGHPEWYSFDYSNFYMESNFKGEKGELTITKCSMIMTGYYNEKLTIYEKEPYTVWNVRRNDAKRELILVNDDGSECPMEMIEPIQGLEWQEYEIFDFSSDQARPYPSLDLANVRIPVIAATHPKK